MSLLSEFLAIAEDWRCKVFPQQRTFQRGVRQALGSLVSPKAGAARLVSFWANGGQNRSWSAEHFLHSRCHWEPQQLFQPILKRALAYCPQHLVGVAIDDTRLRKTGRAGFRKRSINAILVAAVSPQSGVGSCASCRLRCWYLLHRNAPVGTRQACYRFASRKSHASEAPPERKPPTRCRNSIGKR